MIDFTQMKAFSEDPLILTEGEGIRVVGTRRPLVLRRALGDVLPEPRPRQQRVVEAASGQLATRAGRADARDERPQPRARSGYSALLPPRFTTLKSGTAARRRSRRRSRWRASSTARPATAQVQGAVALSRLSRRDRTGAGRERLAREPEPVRATGRRLRPSPHARPLSAAASTSTRRDRRDRTPGWSSRSIELEGPETIAALITEPILMSAGVVSRRPTTCRRSATLRSLRHRAHLRRDHHRLRADGHLFAPELFGAWPDILVLGKGMTGGYAPLSATSSQTGSRRPSGGRPGLRVRAGHTYAGNPVACAAGLAALQELPRAGPRRERRGPRRQALGRLRSTPGARSRASATSAARGSCSGSSSCATADTKEPFPAAEQRRCQGAGGRAAEGAAPAREPLDGGARAAADDRRRASSTRCSTSSRRCSREVLDSTPPPRSSLLRA